MARPNVLVGHWPLSGPGREDQYLIYGNFFYQNPNEALFQGEGNLAFYNNLLVNDFADAVHIQPHNDIPRRISIFFNTVITPQVGIAVRQREDELLPPGADFRQWVIANAVFAAQPIVARDREGNITGSVSQAQDYLRNPAVAPSEMDLRPINAMTAKFDPAPLEEFLDWNLDFDGVVRTAGEVGAYSAEQAASYWVPRLDLKPVP